MDLLTYEEKVKELHNLLNSFELCYPIIKKNIDKFDIKSIKHKCYLGWTAGITYFNSKLSLTENIFLDYFFDKIYETFNIKKMNLKAILFSFFSFGAVVSINKYEVVKDLLKDYYNIIAIGIVLIQRIKYDYIENGIKKWSIETIKKYAFFNDKSAKDNSHNPLKEFQEIINGKEKEHHENKILN